MHIRSLLYLVHGVSGETVGLLRVDVVLYLHVLAAEGVLHAVHRADPVVRPPVLEERREQVPEHL